MKTRILTPVIVLALTIIAWVSARPLMAQITPFSNLNQSTGSAAGISTYSPKAASFTTGNSTFGLSSVDVLMNGFIVGAPTPTQPLLFSLFSNSNGYPDHHIATLSGNDYPTNQQIYTYTATALTLSSNTTYWIVASTSGGTAYGWCLNTSGTVDSGSIWTSGGMVCDYGSGWRYESGYYPQFSVTVTTNLPPLSIAQPIVLSYQPNGYPCVLQQCTSLTTTNWVTASNAIPFTCIGTNLSGFIVPPSSPQMFFRMH